MKKKGKTARKSHKMLFGIGLDNKDGHTRITRGENFELFGGSDETHTTMQEKAVKMNEQLKRRGQTLDTVSREEFYEIADRVGLPLIDSHKARRSN